MTTETTVPVPEGVALTVGQMAAALAAGYRMPRAPWAQEQNELPPLTLGSEELTEIAGWAEEWAATLAAGGQIEREETVAMVAAVRALLGRVTELEARSVTTTPSESTPARLAEIAARAHALAVPPVVAAEAARLLGEDVPALLAEVERLRAERDHLRARVEELVRQRDDALVEIVTAEADGELGPVTPLRWGLDDVEWGDDDTTRVLLSGPDLRPYVLELDRERASALRTALAGPAGDTSRAAAFREMQDATVAWLEWTAAKERSAAQLEGERWGETVGLERRERAELISTLASLVDCGAVRQFLDAAPTPGEARWDAARETVADLEER